MSSAPDAPPLFTFRFFLDALDIFIPAAGRGCGGQDAHWYRVRCRSHRVDHPDPATGNPVPKKTAGRSTLHFSASSPLRGARMVKNWSADMAGYSAELQNHPYRITGRSGEDQETCRKRINSSHSHFHDRGYGFYESAGV